MDGVSAAASVVSLVETSLKVVSCCAEYYSHVKNAKKDADRLCLEINSSVFFQIWTSLLGVQEQLDFSRQEHSIKIRYPTMLNTS